ncbi:MAG: flagellar biosynthetic protein FliO [Rhodospirillales bacterium]|nr:flagellar biosynthetic protein FliO [Rhodospirillales bacterium]
MKMVLALVFVLGLMGLLALAMKQLGLGGKVSAPGTKRRLKVVETMPLDARHRMALIQRDDVQHLVIFGPNGETVVETNIAPVNNE